MVAILAVAATMTAGQATGATNCAYCVRQPKCDRSDRLCRRADRLDRVLVCRKYYPEALHRAGYPVDTQAAREHRDWIEQVIR